MHWFIDGLQKYFDFSGRANREAFWMFYLVIFIVGAVFEVLERIPGLADAPFIWLGGLFSLFTLIPFIALSARRLHDIGRSGWWQLIGLIPIIGWIILLYFFIKEGDAGTNAYGASPNSSGGTPVTAKTSDEPYVAKPRHNPAYK